MIPATGLCTTLAGCLAAGPGTLGAALWGGAGVALAAGIRTAAGHTVTELFTWWTGAPAPPVQPAALARTQRYVIALIAAPVAVLAILASVAWNVAGPAGSAPTWPRDLARGLLVFGVTTAGSIPVVTALQRWTEDLSAGLLGQIPTEDVGRRLVAGLAGLDPVQAACWSALVLAVGLLQYLALLLRDGAVAVLTVLLPVAAAGQFSRGGVLWLPRVTGWLLAFLMFRPAAALVYDVGFSLVGRGTGLADVGEGLCVMVTAVLALPALLRLTWFAVSAPPLTSAVADRAREAVTTGASLASSAVHLQRRREGPS